VAFFVRVGFAPLYGNAIARDDVRIGDKYAGFKIPSRASALVQSPSAANGIEQVGKISTRPTT